ncbi:transforming acidic coiled-coil-containing protein 3 isoform X2 [Petaurus breviceps papuanus]|uniref:transforming acidic coiled-coil-containing protein 3 isoform X2 n=1 Tax=Petaurus breviceps papuanus TaxID=3040969 RepID=UPI0036DC04BC
MSLHFLNDENVSGDITTETCDFLFSPPELTGRSSIFRTSQKENVPPKNIAKAMKVTFQTPLRDPQTNRILSPTMTGKIENSFTLSDCTDDLKNSHPPASRYEKNQQVAKEVDRKTMNKDPQRQETHPAPYPDDLLPAKSSGSYSIDMDGLVDFDPFVNSSQIPASFESLLKSPIVTDPEIVLEEIDCYSLDDTFPLISESFKRSPGIKSSRSPEKISEKSCDSVRSASLPDKSTNEINRESALEDESDGSVETPELTMKEVVSNKEEQKSSLDFGQPEEPVSITAHEIPSAGVSTHLLACNSDFVSSDEKKAIDSESPNLPLVEEKTVQVIRPLKDQPLKLEFDFSDNITVKPPPSKLRIPLLKKPPATQKKVTENLAQESKCQDKENMDPLPKGSYNLDWDKLNDPNFNPFGKKSKPSVSDHQKSSNETIELQENHIDQKDCLSSKEQTSVTVIDDIPRSQQVITPVAASESVLPLGTETLIAGDQEERENSSNTSVDTSSQISPALTTGSEQPQKDALDADVKVETAVSEEDFRSPSQVLGTGIEIDYLEQFGTSLFKDSALRKQSLYLKFDPLLRDSPDKPTPVTTEITNSLLDISKQSQENQHDAKLDEFDFLGTLNIPVTGLPPPDGLECLGVPVIATDQPVSVDAIIDVLKYSQKDMDLAIEKVKEEIKENDELMKICDDLISKMEKI